MSTQFCLSFKKPSFPLTSGNLSPMVCVLLVSFQASKLIMWKDTVGMLQELITRWVGSTTGNQRVMLIEAVVMCDEPAVAQELATAVGCPLALSGTTTEIDTNEIKLLIKLLVCGLNVPF